MARLTRFFCACVGLALLAGPVSVSARAPLPTPAAPPVVASLDFEEFDLGGGVYLDIGSPLVYTNPGGLGMVLIEEGADNRIYDLLAFGNRPPTAGQALIDWTWPEGSNPTGTTILFERAMSYFSLEAGDFGGDDDSPLKITAYNAAGQVIGLDTKPWGGSSFPPFAALTVSVPGIRKVVYQSGGAYANSTFIDNIKFGDRFLVFLPTGYR